MNTKANFENISQQTAGYYTLLMQDNSTNKLHCASLLKFESHYPPNGKLYRQVLIKMSEFVTLILYVL